MDKLGTFLNALNDVQILIDSGFDKEMNKSLLQEFKSNIIMNFRENFEINLCHQVEDYLRITIHSILINKISSLSPFNLPSLTRLQSKIALQPIIIFNERISIKNDVEKYLETMFYDLNMLNAFDFETYELMRELSKNIFGLDLVFAHIPCQSLEQGAVDLVNLIRSI